MVLSRFEVMRLAKWGTGNNAGRGRSIVEGINVGQKASCTIGKA
jgi:hypothetical protein